MKEVKFVPYLQLDFKNEKNYKISDKRDGGHK